MSAVGVRMVVTRARSRGTGASLQGVGEKAAPLRSGEAAAGSAAPEVGHRRRGGEGNLQGTGGWGPGRT